MDDRGYVAQALFDRLRGEEVEFRLLGDARGYPETAGDEIDLAVRPEALRAMPRAVARFCHEFDLQLVQLLREPRGWNFVLAWSDDLGRPHFLAARVFSDFYVGARRLLHSEELLRASPDVRFIHGLATAVESGALGAERTAWLSDLWHENPRLAMERIAQLWRKRAEIRILAQAAKHGDWTRVRGELPRLRRALRRGVRPRLDAALARLGILAGRVVQPPDALIAFIGPDVERRSGLMRQVARDLAPAFPTGLATLEHGFHEQHEGINLRVVLEAPEGFIADHQDVVEVDGTQTLAVQVSGVERQILRWLECRVEQRYPAAVVGDNPLAARLLQFACRHRIPLLLDLMQTLLNCGVDCRIRSPILMPHPFGIVIDKDALIGNRVTVMHQVSIGSKHPDHAGAPVIEDNVFIGAGAKILGAVRVGRGATVGANAVVTRDVPSHCTVVGVNRILGQEEVVEKRQADRSNVVNM
jgi:serine O-acetyltransferase